MKIFKSTLSIALLLFAASSLFAARKTEEGKAVAQAPAKFTPAKKPTTPQKKGRVRTTREKATAVKTPAVQAPITSEIKTYKQLTDYVKNNKTAWNDATKQLNTSFVDGLGNEALAADLEDYQYDALLQLARDYHAIFTGDSAKDKEILNNLAQERGKLVEWFNMGKKAKYELQD